MGAIELPAGPKSLGNGAFSNCSSLGAIELSAGITSLGMHAFDGPCSRRSLTDARRDRDPYRSTAPAGRGLTYERTSATKPSPTQ